MTCSAGGTCQCNYANQYWSSSLKKCLIYRGYGDSCDSDAGPVFLCKSGLTCQLTPSCMCPHTVGNSSCDCLITQYWDGTSKKSYTQNNECLKYLRLKYTNLNKNKACQNRSSHGGPCTFGQNYTCTFNVGLWCNTNSKCDCSNPTVSRSSILWKLSSFNSKCSFNSLIFVKDEYWSITQLKCGWFLPLNFIH
jgi:hypothetical protein